MFGVIACLIINVGEIPNSKEHISFHVYFELVTHLSTRSARNTMGTMKPWA